MHARIQSPRVWKKFQNVNFENRPYSAPLSSRSGAAFGCFRRLRGEAIIHLTALGGRVEYGGRARVEDVVPDLPPLLEALVRRVGPFVSLVRAHV